MQGLESMGNSIERNPEDFLAKKRSMATTPGNRNYEGLST